MLWLDKKANWIIGGDKRETISGRMGRNMHIRWAKWSCEFLDLIFREDNHCQKSIQEIKDRDTNDHPIIFFTVFVILLIAIIEIARWVNGIF